MGFTENGNPLVAGRGHPSQQVYLSILESETNIGDEVRIQSWFIRSGADIIKSEVYLLEAGPVVAYQDCINGVNGPLYVDATFRDFYEGEPAFANILSYAGVMDPDKIELYYTGR